MNFNDSTNDNINLSPEAHKSTGPRTEAGKQRSKYNALKHGIFSGLVVLKGESRKQWDVDDIAAVVSKAEAIGARLLIAPTTLPEGGEIAVMHDPQGMPFVICRREGGRAEPQRPPHAAQELLRSAPYFPVADVEQSVSYYERVLGFQREYAAGTPPQFAIVSRDGLSIMLRLVSAPEEICPNERQGGTWDAFFWVADVLTLHEELRTNGASIVYGPLIQDAYQMHEFAIRDRDGHVLGFGELLPAQAQNRE